MTPSGSSYSVLVYAAISMLVEIEKSFNQIYNAPRAGHGAAGHAVLDAAHARDSLLVASFYAQDRSTTLRARST